MGDAGLGETTGEAEGRRVGIIMSAWPARYYWFEIIGYPVRRFMHKIWIQLISTKSCYGGNIQHAKQDNLIAVTRI